MLRCFQRLLTFDSKIQSIKNGHKTNVWKTVPKYTPKFSNKIMPNYVNRKLSFGIWGISILSWLGFASEDEEKESELIMTLKRAVLCMNREQFAKAEQLLHIALKIAQDQQNEQGIVYCYDLMANLAFDQQIFDKAEKLFVEVLKSILSKGTKQDDVKVRLLQENK